MKPEIKEKWLIALRSNEYKQGKDWLRSNVGGVIRYCCLGVLCDLYIKETGIGEWQGKGNSSSIFVSGEVVEAKELPTEVQEWSGISDRIGYIHDQFHYNLSLATKNDESSDFEKVIVLIEEHF